MSSLPPLRFGAALLFLLTSQLAHALPPQAELRAQIRGRPEAAGRVPLAVGDAQAYLRDKTAMSEGHPETLSAPRRAGALSDWRWLLYGRAQLAQGKLPAAERALLRALKEAQLAETGVAAARALIEVYEQQGRYRDQLTVIDALLAQRRISGRSKLRMRKAEALLKLNDKGKAAPLLARVARDLAGSPRGDTAEQRLTSLTQAGAAAQPETPAQRLARIRVLIANKAFTRAEAAMERLGREAPKQKDALALLKLSLLRGQRRYTAELAELKRLRRAGLSDKTGPVVLARLAKRALRADDNKQATRYYDELRRRYPRSKEATEGEFLAAWLPYREGNFKPTVRRMLAYERAHPKDKKAADALWYAGWAAYLDHRYPQARRAWAKLFTDHPRSSLVAAAHYWTGRSFDMQRWRTRAKAAYQAASEAAPLSYYGFWARYRLGTPLRPALPKPARQEQALAQLEALGPKRPLALDRLYLFNTIGARAEAELEMASAWQQLRRSKDRAQLAKRADLFTALGAHYYAYLAGRKLWRKADSTLPEEAADWLDYRRVYPEAFGPEVRAASRDNGVDPHKIWAIMRTESRFRPWVRSPAGARGLMQLMPRTARGMGRRHPPAKPYAARYQEADANVWLGSWYLGQLLIRYRQQLALAAGGYNAGPKAMDRWLAESKSEPLDVFVERVPYRETRRYMRRVLETYWVYRLLSDRPPLVSERLLTKTSTAGLSFLVRRRGAPSRTAPRAAG